LSFTHHFNGAGRSESNKELVNVSLLIDKDTCPASNHLTVTIRRAGNLKAGAMHIHILEEAGQGLAAIDKSIRLSEVEIRRAQPVEPIEPPHLFAGWSLDETTRDLISPAGQRVDLTSSEFDLLMAFVRHPGQPLSRAALLGVLRGRQWTYFDRSIDTLVARLRKKLDDGADRSPLIRSVRGIGYVFCAAVGRLGDLNRSPAASRLAPRDGAAPQPAL
jgi:DNA-binding winged helix-turn-helix (wHTH) protein